MFKIILRLAYSLVLICSILALFIPGCICLILTKGFEKLLAYSMKYTNTLQNDLEKIIND